MQNIITIYNEHKNRKYLQKLKKMSILKAWVQRPSGLIKRGR